MLVRYKIWCIDIYTGEKNEAENGYKKLELAEQNKDALNAIAKENEYYYLEYENGEGKGYW